MKRTFAVIGIAASVSAATPASSQVVLEMGSINCKEFAGFEPATKALVAAWVLGYFNASRNLNLVQERYVDRNLEKMGEHCKHHHNDKLLDVIEKVGH